MVATLAVVSLPARAAFVITGNAADQTTFINMINGYSTGGAWSLNMVNQLVWTANGGAVDFFASRLNTFNGDNLNNRTVDVKQNYPGVLVGAFGPLAGQPNGTQLLDLGDIQKFSLTTAAQPLLDLQPSVMIHELGEVYQDGGAANFNNAHVFGGITEENSQLAALGSRGQRQTPGDQFTALGGNQWQLKIPWRDVPNNKPGWEVITGTTTAGMFNITQIAPGLAETGATYDGSRDDIAIDSIYFQPVPEPRNAGMLFGLGLLIFGCGWSVRQRSNRLPAAA